MTTVNDLVQSQDLDQEHDADIRDDIERERSSPTVRVNALTREQYYSRHRPQHNLRAGTAGVLVDTEPTEVYDRGGDKHDPGVKLAQAYRPAPDVSNNLVNEGHGFVAGSHYRFSNPDLPTTCRYCGDRLLTEDESSPCEFAVPTLSGPLKPAETATKYGVPVLSGPVHTGRVVGPGEVYGHVPLQRFVRPPAATPVPISDVVEYAGPRAVTDGRCRCNGCVARAEGKRKRGGQPIQCGKPECKKAKRSDDNRRTNERKRRDQRRRAARMLEQFPYMSDREIADTIGCALARVREARSSPMI